MYFQLCFTEESSLPFVSSPFCSYIGNFPMYCINDDGVIGTNVFDISTDNTDLSHKHQLVKWKCRIVRVLIFLVKFKNMLSLLTVVLVFKTKIIE